MTGGGGGEYSLLRGGKMLAIILLAASLAPQIQTGFNQSGAVHLTGPGMDVWGAYEMSMDGPEWTFYRFKVVVSDGEVLRDLPPDIVLNSASVTASGTQLGHYIWTANDWRLEMICIDETVRTQVSWEAERMGYRVSGGSKQNVSITVGRDSITFLVKRSESRQ